MISPLLFIWLIIFLGFYSDGFLKFNNFLLKRNVGMISFFHPKLNVMLSSLCFYDGDDKKSNDFTNNIVYGGDILYTLIWFDCDDCKGLLQDVKKEGKDVFYINGSHYFFDDSDESNSPLFYKKDELIATDIFSIYEELFYDNRCD